MVLNATPLVLAALGLLLGGVFLASAVIQDQKARRAARRALLAAVRLEALLQTQLRVADLSRDRIARESRAPPVSDSG
jgi:hypothetical protein